MRITLLLPLLLSACGPSMAEAPPKFITEYPPAWSMAQPVTLPAVKPGEELFASNAQCSAAYVKETGKLQALQRWVITLKK